MLAYGEMMWLLDVVVMVIASLWLWFGWRGVRVYLC